MEPALLRTQARFRFPAPHPFQTAFRGLLTELCRCAVESFTLYLRKLLGLAVSVFGCGLLVVGYGWMASISSKAAHETVQGAGYLRELLFHGLELCGRDVS